MAVANQPVHVTVLGHRPPRHHFLHRGLFEPRHKVHLALAEFDKPLVIDVAAVEHQHRAGIELELARHAKIMRFTRGDHGERGQIAGVVQQQVQLEGAFGALNLRPVKHRHAQVDDAGIKTEQAVFEPKLVASGGQPELSTALAEQLLEDGFEQLPGPLPVGVGKRGALGRCRQAEVLELALGRGQPATDLAQRVGLAELTKQHGHELAPAGETAQVAVGVVANLDKSGLRCFLNSEGVPTAGEPQSVGGI